jgi:hypothetical protein
LRSSREKAGVLGSNLETAKAVAVATGADETEAATPIRRLGVDHALNREVRRDAVWIKRKDQHRLKMRSFAPHFN